MKYKSKIFARFEFTQNFFRFLLVDRINLNKDNIVLVTGKRGDGKTSLALKLLLGLNDMEKFSSYYNEEYNRSLENKTEQKLEGFKAFDMEEHLAFTRKKLQELCKGTYKGFIQADEAIVNAARRNSMTKANKVLHEILTINRKNLNTLFFCLPTIEDFDISILQYVTHWIHIDDRGLAAVLLPEAKSIFGRKTWDVDKMKKIYDKFMEENPGITSVPYWLFDNFRGYIRWKALGVRIEERYLKIAHEQKNLDTEEEEKPVIKRNEMPEEKRTLLEKITTGLLEGKIKEPEEYYKYCGALEFNKQKLNKEINELLAKKGDGRNATKVIRDNKQKEEQSFEAQVKANKVIY